MPPELTFRPTPGANGAAEPGPTEIDLAGDRRPRCTVAVPAASGPGIWCGECGCGASFAVTVSGNGGDPRRLLLACWERALQTPPGRMRQTNLL